MKKLQQEKMQITSEINYQKLTSLLFSFLLVLVIIITIFPLFKVGFVHGDDIQNYINANPESWRAYITHNAIYAGRFYFLLVEWVYLLPYAVDSLIYYHAMRIIPIIVGVFLLFYLIKRLDFNKPYILFTVLIFFSSFQITGICSPITGYPFYFTFAVVLVLSALHLIVSYFKTKKYYYIILSALLMAFASLFQESLFMYYVLIFCFILIQYDLKTIFKKDNILKFTKEITPFILLGVAYVIVYFWFGSKHPSQHAGNQFVSAISISQMFGTFVQILKSSSPLYSFLSSKFDLIQMSSRVTADNSFWFYLKDASLMSYIKACLIVLLFLFSIKLLPQEMSRGKLYKLLLISILVVILPILPQLFSVKVYQSQFPIKITSYFSFIGIVLFWATLLYIANLYLLKKPVVYKLFCGLVSLVLFFAALLTQYTNEKVAEDINIAQDKFLIINDFKDTANLRDGDILYAESLLYTKNKSGSIMFNKNILFFNQAMNNFFDHRVVSFKDYESLYNKYCQSEDTINLLFYAQASKSHDTYIALVKCAGKDLTKHVADIKNDNIIVGYRSTYKDFSVNIASDNVQSLSVNNKKLKSFGNMHVLNVSYLPSKSVSSFSIVGENIWPASLSISNITNPYANTIKIGKYDKWIEKIYVEQIKATILNDKQWTQAIQEKAEKRNVPFEQMLNDDALWYIYK